MQFPEDLENTPFTKVPFCLEYEYYRHNCDDSNMHSAKIGAYLYKSFGHESVVSLSFNKNWNVNSSLAKYFDTYAPRTSLKLQTHLGQSFYPIIFDFSIITTRPNHHQFY